MAHNVALRTGNQISDNHELRERNRQEFLDEGANTWSRIQNHHRLSKRDLMIIALATRSHCRALSKPTLPIGSKAVSHPTECGHQ